MVKKFVVSSRDTSPGEPPSLAKATLYIPEEEFTYEYEVIQAIYQALGEGYYSVSSHLGDQRLNFLWKGRVEEENGRISYFVVESHFLEESWLKIKEKPIQGDWKVCRKEKVIDEDYVEYHDQ